MASVEWGKRAGGGRTRSSALWELAAATALILAGSFCAWQAWLLGSQGRVAEQAHADRDALAAALGNELSRQRALAQHALAAPELAALADHAELLDALRTRLPQASKVELYDGELDEVLHADYRHFGYAKAAQLLAAPAQADHPLAQSVNVDGTRRLSFALPLGAPAHPRAWVWLELPFTTIQQCFEAARLESGSLQLNQGERYGDLVLLTRGSGAAEYDASKPVAGSGFSVRAGLPAAFIVMSSFSSAALGALLGLLAGGYLLWRRRYPTRGALPTSDDVPLPAVIKRPRQAALPSAVAALEPPPAPAAAPIDPHMFRAYDIRGVVDRGLDRAFAVRLGLAIGALMGERGLGQIVIGRDGRRSGALLSEGLIEGLRFAAIDVIDIGAAPTPVVYFAAFQFNTGCAVAVTGSHNPPDYNGFKIVIGGETLADAAIQDLYGRMIAQAPQAEGEGEGEGEGDLRVVDVSADYLERILGDVQLERPFKVVVDAGNGIAGILGPQLLQELGASVVPLYCEVDGDFPNHQPDPSDPRNLRDLILTVKQTGAELGLAFDGDGDRLAVVSAEGEVIYADRLLMLFARDVLSRRPGATVIYDVKCTGQLKSEVLGAGGSPLMWRTGHSPIKSKMRETDAELAGEMSGHFFFRERWYGFDDGIYAAARLLEILAGDPEQRSPVQIFASLPKGVSTPELKIEMAEGAPYRFMQTLHEQASFDDAALSFIDGIRADWPDGWGLVRASNTTPALVLRFEADHPAALQRIQQVFRERLLAVDSKLQLPF